MSIASGSKLPLAPPRPPLHAGDRVTRDDFQRRLEALPDGTKAELIRGAVYLPSPGVEQYHGAPHAELVALLGMYQSAAPGLIGAVHTSVRLDRWNMPQPDAYLRVCESHGGRSRRSTEGYLDGPPELIAEIAASSISYELHDKLKAYQRNRVLEYVVWRTYDSAIDWFVLRGGRYEKLACSADGIYRSEVFPGLWLDAAALIRGDLAPALAVVQQGAASPEHAEFVKRLQQANLP